jgi:cbb3-type cytochrome oxidase maturation protein
MNILMLLIPVTLLMGGVGLGAFFWNLHSGQYDDLAGDAERILFDDGDRPLPARPPLAPKETSR